MTSLRACFRVTCFYLAIREAIQALWQRVGLTTELKLILAVNKSDLLPNQVSPLRLEVRKQTLAFDIYFPFALSCFPFLHLVLLRGVWVSKPAFVFLFYKTSHLQCTSPQAIQHCLFFICLQPFSLVK